MLWTRNTKTKGEESVDWERVVEGARSTGLSTRRTIPRRVPLRLPLTIRKRELLDRLYSPQGLCGQSNDAVFGIRDFDLAVARCSVGLGLTLDELDAFRKELLEQLVPVVVDPDIDRCSWTTKTNLDHEWYIHHRLADLASDTNRIQSPSPDAIEWAIRSLEDEGIVLDDEQRAIVFQACASGLLFIEGYAGVGKTVTMRAVVRALRHRVNNLPTTDRIIAISTARDTAIRTGTKLEAENLDSVESFCRAVQRRKIRPTERTVIFLDEAVMVDNARMAELLKHSGQARLVCIGDRKQLQCIGAGGWYVDAVGQYGVTTLTKVHRQINEQDVAALFDLRSGRARAALENLHHRNRVHIDDSRAESIGRAVERFIAERDGGRQINDIKVVLDGANTEIDSINRILQLDRLARGELKGSGYAMSCLRSGRNWTIYEGDEVSFCVGYYHKDSGIYVPNGKRARVLAIDEPAGEILVQVNGWLTPTKLYVSHETFEQPVTPDYAIHALRLQGGEAPIILALPGNGTTSLEAGYSQASRCIEEVHVFVDRETHGGESKSDPIEVLISRWTKARPKISARTRMTWTYLQKVWRRVPEKETIGLV